ncbi:MAG: 7-carboxy-7-deazaguanine synthase QueE [Deltaproteobacteria bacterium]|nr:7-carboxy-7-deazaguanine synthase QueE [Deltaproteobacteria bacterium]
MIKAKIIEIFSSIQGEGLWVGRPQVFVRFKGCRLECVYCDTPLTHSKIRNARIEYPPFSRQFETRPLEFSVEELNGALARFAPSSLAITGGEPLEQVDFLEVWLTQLNRRYEILLETNGVEEEALKRIIHLIDMVSLDIKLPSATGEPPYWEMHDRFIEAAGPIGHYAKVVFDEKMTDDEIERLTIILQKHAGLVTVFQPVSPVQKRDLKVCLEIFGLFSEKFPGRVRLIPQTHKLMSLL